MRLTLATVRAYSSVAACETHAGNALQTIEMIEGGRAEKSPAIIGLARFAWRSANV